MYRSLGNEETCVISVPAENVSARNAVVVVHVFPFARIPRTSLTPEQSAVYIYTLV
jgi:hypothetical protein